MTSADESTDPLASVPASLRPPAAESPPLPDVSPVPPAGPEPVVAGATSAPTPAAASAPMPIKLMCIVGAVSAASSFLGANVDRLWSHAPAAHAATAPTTEHAREEQPPPHVAPEVPPHEPSAAHGASAHASQHSSPHPVVTDGGDARTLSDSRDHRGTPAMPDAGPSLTRLVLDLASVKELAARMPAPKSVTAAHAQPRGLDAERAQRAVSTPSVSAATPSSGPAPTR